MGKGGSPRRATRIHQILKEKGPIIKRTGKGDPPGGGMLMANLSNLVQNHRIGRLISILGRLFFLWEELAYQKRR